MPHGNRERVLMISMAQKGRKGIPRPNFSVGFRPRRVILGLLIPPCRSHPPREISMRPAWIAALAFASAIGFTATAQEKKKEEKYLDPINVEVPHVSTDKTVKLDYDIVYVRAPRAGDKVHKRFF